MALGLEQALAEYLGAELGWGLYDDADPAQRIVFLMQQPPVPELAAPGADVQTSAALAVTVFADGGTPPTRTMSETHTVTIQTRHALFETCAAEARRIHDLLHENGGAGVSAQAQGRFGSVRVLKITADFPPTFLGRDPAPREGRALFSQSFTVRVLAPVPFS